MSCVLSDNRIKKKLGSLNKIYKIMLTSKLQFSYNVIGKVLENNLKSQYSHIKQSIILKSCSNNIYSFVVFRGFSTTFKPLSNERQQNIRPSKHESVDMFSTSE